MGRRSEPRRPVDDERGDLLASNSARQSPRFYITRPRTANISRRRRFLGEQRLSCGEGSLRRFGRRVGQGREVPHLATDAGFFLAVEM